jgi:AraC family transcriptional regulator
VNLVGNALWYIEMHLGEEISLEDIAAAGDVSRFQMARAFGLSTGRPVMRHVRGRRLTEAARALSRGAPDILGVALDAGYGSHEAFTRAFREQFGVTPEAARARGDLDNLELVEPITMTETSSVDLEEPRREACAAMLIAGLRERYPIDNVAGIPMQWQRFRAYLDAIPGRIGRATYGVCDDFGEPNQFDYVAGVAVSRLDDLPPEFSGVRLAAAEYLVFRHRGHISRIGGTWRTIMDGWLPTAGIRMAEAPCFERVGEEFNPETGTGGIEIWIPVAG